MQPAGVFFELLRSSLVPCMVALTSGNSDLGLPSSLGTSFVMWAQPVPWVGLFSVHGLSALQFHEPSGCFDRHLSSLV